MTTHIFLVDEGDTIFIRVKDDTGRDQAARVKRHPDPQSDKYVTMVNALDVLLYEHAVSPNTDPAIDYDALAEAYKLAGDLRAQHMQALEKLRTMLLQDGISPSILAEKLNHTATEGAISQRITGARRKVGALNRKVGRPRKRPE